MKELLRYLVAFLLVAAAGAVTILFEKVFGDDGALVFGFLVLLAVLIYALKETVVSDWF